MGMTPFVVTFCAITMSGLQDAAQPTVDELLARYSAHQGRIDSWIIRTSNTVELQSRSRSWHRRLLYDVRFDGVRVSVRWHEWGDIHPDSPPLPREKAAYRSLLWDGKRYINYGRSADPNDPGFAAIDNNQNEREIKLLQYENPCSPLLGFYGLTTYRRIDEVIQQGESVSVRAERDTINGVDCYVIDAATKQGDYTLWIDPEHGYNIAKVHIRISKARGHLQYGQPMKLQEIVFTRENTRFAAIDGVWLPTHSVFISERTLRDGNRYVDRAHVDVNDVDLNPDHDAQNSFAATDIPNGTKVWLVPILQILYTWQNGDLVARIDEDVVTRMNDAIHQMLADADRDSNSLKTAIHADPNVQDETPARVSARPHCGLYCLYSMLRLIGQDLDYRDLVKPEYLGSQRGSSLANLKRGAIDYGLHAEVGMRLSVDALRKCPYAAILHVRRHAKAREYDHYELFLGSEKGKAKLLNPPEPPQLVSFHELAALWDGNALFLSERPFNVDAILGTNRKQLFVCAIAGIAVIGALYAMRHVWLSTVGVLPRRWSMGLTIAQCALLCVAAGAAGMLYHFGNSDGLLANGEATADLQDAYRGTFVPRISEGTTQKLIRGDIVLIDARFAQDYERGHLDRAISIPVDANDAIWRERTALIPKDKKIIVYCQSAGCKFAENVSVRLMEDGFDGIRIFRGGWNEWVAKHPEAQKQTSEDHEKQHDET